MATASQPVMPPPAPITFSPASDAPAVGTAPAARPVPTPLSAAPAAAGDIRALPLKTQASGNDARAERFYRQVRAEVDDLRKAIGERRNVDHEFAELDLEAVAKNPEAAALIPPEVLVKALVEAHSENARLQQKLERSRARGARTEARLRRLKEKRAFEKGRLETMDRVAGALHGNIEDLRLARGNVETVREERPEPRVLRPGALPPAAHETLPPAENA